MKNFILKMSGIAAAAALFCAGCGEKESPVTPIGGYSLTINRNPANGGAVTREPNASAYAAAEEVIVTALVAPGYKFTGWTGAVTDTAPTITITMDGHKTLTANFEPYITHTLNVTPNPTTGGTVSRVPDYEIYADSELVIVEASPAPGYLFTGWSGASTDTASIITITMDGDKTLTANFAAMYTLNVVANGGSVSRYPDKPSYTAGETVTVTAEAKENYKFTGWSGASVSKDAAITVTMDSDKILTAHFELKTYTLTTNALPTAGGEVFRHPDKPEYAYNEEVTVMAAANSGYRFTGWIGLEDTASAVTFKMGNSNMTLGAIFEEKIETMP